MARHRKVSVVIWTDAKFMELSDDGKLLFFFMLTTPQQTSLGAMEATLAGMAEKLRWLPVRLSKAFEELSSKGMAKHDRRACCIWLPNFLRYNGPESPNVVKAWASALELIPECSLKWQALQRAKDILKGYSPTFLQAFHKAIPQDFAHPLPIPEQEQEPKQEPERERARAGDEPRLNGHVEHPTPSAEAVYSTLLEDWRRDVPEVNADAFAKWIVHVELQGKQMSAGMRLAQARRLAGQGDADVQSKVVEFCIEQGYRSLIPWADVRARTEGMTRSGNGSGRKYAPSATAEQMEAEIAQGLRNSEGTWISPEPNPHV